MKKVNILMQLLFNAMTTITFFFLDINGVITNPSFKALWLPLLILVVFGLSFSYIMKLFKDYLKSEFVRVLENQKRDFDLKEKEINQLLNKLSQFQSNKYMLRDIQDVVNNHAFLIEKSKKLYEIPNYRDAKIFDLVHNTKVKKLKFIDVENEPDPNNK